MKFLLATMAIFFIIATLVVVDIDLTVNRFLNNTVPEMVTRNITDTRNDLMAQIDDTRNVLDSRIANVQRDLNEQLNATRNDATFELGNIHEDLNRRLDATLYIAAKELSEANKTLSTTSEGMLEQSGALTKRALDVEPMYRSRYLATTGELNKTLDAFRLTANAFADVAPDLAKNANTTSASVAEMSKNFALWSKPESFWKRALFGGTSALVLKGVTR